MTTIKRKQGWTFILKVNNKNIKTLFNMWKIWLTKKEISEIYWVKKSEIKRELNKVLLNSDLDLVENIKKVYNSKKEKKETFYSLDILLLLWYSSKHFKETKFLVNTNNLLKKYTASRKHNTSKIKPLFDKIFNYLTPTHN